jgi:hypothetical protein
MEKSRRVSFGDEHAIQAIVSFNRQDSTSTSTNDSLPESDKSDLWYTDQDFSRWRSEAASLVNHILMERSSASLLRTGAENSHKGPLICFRGLEHMLHGNDDTTSSTVDTVLVTQRRQRRRGFCDEEELAVVSSTLSSRSQQEAIERARQDFEEVERDYHALRRCNSATTDSSCNNFLNQPQECTLPKRGRGAYTRIVRMLRRGKRNAMITPLEQTIIL